MRVSDAKIFSDRHLSLCAMSNAFFMRLFILESTVHTHFAASYDSSRR